MADFTTTTNLSLKKPAIGGSSDKWGEYINANLDTIDIEIQTLKTASSSRTLESLSNVLNLTPTTGQVLQYGIASWSATTLSIPEDVEDLSNVTVTSPSDGQVLTWSTSNSRWENQTPGAATIPNGSITSAKLSTSLQGQLNLILQTTGTPTDDQILRYNATTTNWEFQDLPGGTISALSDTDVSGISNQDVLVYNSTSGDWVSRPLAIADVTGLQTALDAKLESSDLSVSSLTDTTITTTADNSVLVYDASDSKWKNEGPSTARSSLGLGTLATQNTITESQISDLGSYITASSTDTLTNKSGAISQWTNDSGYLTAETNDLGSAVTGTLQIANGGTGQTTASAARIALLPTLGTAGQVLAVNTGTTDVEWVNAASGGGSGTVTSVAISGTDGIEVDSGSPVTTSGTIALGINAATLSSHLSLGTAATTAATDYATVAQGALADSAVQPGDDANTLGSGSATDGYVLTANGSGGAAWEQILAVQTNTSNTFSANQIISVADDTNAALRITQTGIGDALVVEDSANPDSTPFVVNNIGRVGIGTVSPASSLDIASAGIRIVVGRKIASNVDEDSLAIIGGTAGGESAEIELYGGSHSTSPSLLVLKGDEQQFRTAAGTERMRIDSSGNVGIGTDAPTEKLDVTGNINATGALTLGSALAVAEGGTGVTSLGSLDAAGLGSGAATDGYVLTADGAGGAAWEAASGVSLPIDLLSSGASIRKSDGTTAVLSESGGAVTLENTSLGDTVLMPDNSNNVSTAPGIRFEADTDTGIGLASAGNLAIVTSGAERMRIDSSGNGTFSGSTFTFAASNNGMVIHKNSVAGATNTPSRLAFDGTSIGSITCLEFKYNGITVGSIVRSTGGTSYNTLSDYRLKTDVQPMTGATERLKTLNPVNFAWIADGTRVDGFLAHEAQEVVPEAITGTKDAVDEDGDPEYQGIDQSKFVPLLTAALQEAIAKIDALETRIQALEV